MRRSVVVGVILLLAACMAFAAADFSGTWVMDKEKSDPIRMGRGGPGGGGGGGGAPADLEVALVINHSGNDMKVVRKMTMGGNTRESEMKYTLDGTENTNPGMMGRGEVKSKSKVEGDKLIIEGTQSMQTQQGDFQINTKDEYSLSADGKVLTVTTTRSTPQGERTTKAVYNKQ